MNKEPIYCQYCKYFLRCENLCRLIEKVIIKKKKRFIMRKTYEKNRNHDCKDFESDIK